jgi:hypothetical protein
MASQVFLIAGFAVIAVSAVLWFRSRIAPDYKATVGDIPRVLAALSASTLYPAFAVFMLAPEGVKETEALNLQFSLEDRHAGFDWVLLSPTNIRDELKFTEFARTAGYSPVMKEENNVRYLRVDTGDLAGLCRDVITKLYQWPESEPMDLIVEGFEWTQQ